MAPWLEARIAEVVDPLRVRRGDLRLRWGGLVTPVVVRAERWGCCEPTARRSSISPASRSRSTRAPPAWGGATAWASVSNPRLSLDRDPQGAFVPSADDLAALSNDESNGSSVALDAWLSPPAEGPLASLEWVRIEDGSVAVRDRALALDWGIAELGAELSRRHAETIDLSGVLQAANAETRLEVPAAALSISSAAISISARARRCRALADRSPASGARLSSRSLDLELAGDARVTLGRASGWQTRSRSVSTESARRIPLWCAAARAGRRRRRRSRRRPRPSGFDARTPRAALGPVSPRRRPYPRSTPTWSSTRARSAALCARSCARRRKKPPSPALSATLEQCYRPSFRPTSRSRSRPCAPGGWRCSMRTRAAERRRSQPRRNVRGSVAGDALALAVSLAGRDGQLQIGGIPSTPLAIEVVEIEAAIAGTTAAPRLDRGEIRPERRRYHRDGQRTPARSRLRGERRGGCGAARARRPRSVLAGRPRGRRASQGRRDVRLGRAARPGAQRGIEVDPANASPVRLIERSFAPQRSIESSSTSCRRSRR